MIRIAVAEDDENCIISLKNHIHTYMEENGITYHIDLYRNGNEIVFNYCSDYDLILMDIQMPGLDGMSAAKEIRKRDQEVIIIFVTSLAQYALAGYQVRARSYLLKPVNYYSLALELNEVMGILSRKTEQSLLLNNQGEIKKVKAADIYYIESQKHKMLVHTKQGIFTVRDTMQNMEEKLRPAFFQRSHVGYLVNLAHVTAISGDLAAVGEEYVPVSRQKRKAFITALTEYIGGDMDD